MFKNTKAIVLREVKYKEADRILTLLTDTDGKITAKARGAFRKGSKLGAGTQFLSFSDMTMFTNKDKWSINEASTIEEFKGLRSDISKLALASYFAECVESIAAEGVADPEMLQLILNSLYALSNDLYSENIIKAAFELRLMEIAGYEPYISECSVCGKEMPEEPMFSMEQGVLMCRKCSIGKNVSLKAITTTELQALRYILKSNPKKLFSFDVSAEEAVRISRITEEYLLKKTERNYGALQYWKKVK